MQDESRARRARSDVDPSETTPSSGVATGPDMLTVGLGIVALLLAAALSLVVFLPDSEAPSPSTTVPAIAATTTTANPPSTDVTSLSIPTTETPTTASQPLAPFSMPEDIAGPWASPDGSATATFSSDALTQMDAVLEGGDLGEIRILLDWPAAIAPLPTATTPSGVVLEALVEINGVRRPARSVAVLVPDDQGLSLRIPLTIAPHLFDLNAPDTQVIASLTLRPAR